MAIDLIINRDILSTEDVELRGCIYDDKGLVARMLSVTPDFFLRSLLLVGHHCTRMGLQMRASHARESDGLDQVCQDQAGSDRLHPHVATVLTPRKTAWC